MKAHTNYYFMRQGQRRTLDNKDPLPEHWQPAYRGKIHAMLLLAQASEEGDLYETVVKPLKADLERDGLAEVWVEHGSRLFYNEESKLDIEPFGYRDGISNPSFFSDENQIGQASHLYLPAAKELVLAPDPLAGEAHCFGSYLVFRKLEQDTKAFGELVEISAAFAKQPLDLAGAQLVGRFEDGTPVTKFDSAQGLEAGTNDFSFDGDDGSRCPLNAHIRKVNPRNGSERIFRIVRRGIPYSEIDDKSGDKKVGMLFMCYQRDIHDQFEFIQRVWIDNPNHPIAGTGVDRLVGQDWSIENHKPVTLQGGEYFFAPSIKFLKERMIDAPTAT
jgi:Dyp-type peroxidase family